MLVQILREFREAKDTISLDSLSRRLKIERSVLNGMLQTLVAQGKLSEVCNPEPGGCGCTSSCSGCGHKDVNQSLTKTYKLN